MYQLRIKAQRIGDQICVNHHHLFLDDGGRGALRNVGLLLTSDTTCCPRKFREFSRHESFKSYKTVVSSTWTASHLNIQTKTDSS
jgi:hypothetical protein